MDDNNEDPASRKRRLAKERKARWWARQSQETMDRIRVEEADPKRKRREMQQPEELHLRQQTDAAAHRTSRQMQSIEQSQQRREADAEAHRISRGMELPEKSQQRREADAVAHRISREMELPEESQQRRDVDAEAHRLSYEESRELKSQRVRNEAVTATFNENAIELDYCGKMDSICVYCSSRNFPAEKPSDGKFTSCCRKGKVKLPKIMDVSGREQAYPEFLRRLLSDKSHPDFTNFREYVRSYNSAVSFASMGAKIVDLPGRGPYVFKSHGTTYHRTSHTEPVNGANPEYAQLYVFDSSEATAYRQNHPANNHCKPTILYSIDQFFRQHNRIAQSYEMMREMQAKEVRQARARGEEIPVVNMAFKRDRRSDQRRYNQPTSNEVAMIFVNNDAEPPFERDIHVYPRNPVNPNQKFININILSPNLDPMSYAILFPYGEPGWQPNWECDTYDGVERNRVRTKVLQYKSALTAIRANFNPLMSAGKLTQQWLVDSYLQVEANDLNFARTKQKQLRAELYQGLADHVENLARNANVAAGVPVILPSSFEGSARNMRERCKDAMSIFSKWGAPDLFITFTANPSWTEITENLNTWDQPSDRPDLVARVFKLKLKSLLDDVTHHGIFGKSIPHVYTIEFQKRGLPHAHILVTLQADDKFQTADRIDQHVRAEIPDPVENPRLHAIVVRCMLHGPCGITQSHASCMEDGKCKKNFPKDFNNATATNVNGYPIYRRRPGLQFESRGALFDNRHVVPYSPYLLLKYNAHINVEICTSLKAVKYIYKYIYKGFDCANIGITSEGDRQLQHNEITNYIDARYLSSPKAMWRLLEFNMHGRSHSVQQLPVHLPNQQRLVFEEGREEDAVAAARTKRTKLESWFELNRVDEEAQQLLYTEIPYHYTYKDSKWQKRQRGGNSIVPRMYTVALKDEERYFLRLLLLHVRGAVSFESIRTFNCVTYTTFKEAASARGLLESDEECDRCLTESSIYQMAKQLRETFSYICAFCQPASPLTLWNKFSEEMSLDYMRNHNAEIANNLARHDIDAILRQHGLSCSAIGLPNPTGIAPADEQYDPVQEAQAAENLIGLLNPNQRQAFNKIIHAVDHEDDTERIFYLDGPGGSGKTFLYNSLMAYIRGRSQVVLPFATTGIAGTLL